MYHIDHIQCDVTVFLTKCSIWYAQWRIRLIGAQVLFFVIPLPEGKPGYALTAMKGGMVITSKMCLINPKKYV